MLYLLFVLTFLCGILFYGMSPSDKSLEMTSHQAEGMIISFINQHQAAKDYVYTWLGVGSSNLRSNDGTLNPEFIKMMPKGIMQDMCYQNQGLPGTNDCKENEDDTVGFPGFISRVVCTNAAGTAVSCNPPSGQEPENYYVITYGGWESDGRNGYKRPNWWPREGSRMRRFESWRKAMKNRTRGSITCGVLTQIGNNWCIDNGETVYKNEAAPNLCMNPVPEAVIGALGYNDNAGKDDLLFCYSEFKQGVRPGHYAKTARYFYDGLSNAGIGQHQSGKDVRSWTNLVDNNPETNNLTWNSITSGANPQNGKWEGSTPYLLLDGYLNTKIKLGESYTLTILLSSFWRDTVNDSVEAIPCGLLQTSDQDNSVTNVTTIFAKISEQLEGTDAVLLNINGETIAEKRASICNMDSRGNNASIVSWTFVVRKEGEVYKLDVYENAKRRFRDEPIEDIKDKYLLLGNSERGQVPHIYGIRYYDSVLTDAQIQKNFKVDQKRFGISDINNGNIGDRCINEGAVKQGGAE